MRCLFATSHCASVCVWGKSYLTLKVPKYFQDQVYSKAKRAFSLIFHGEIMHPIMGKWKNWTTKQTHTEVKDSFVLKSTFNSYRMSWKVGGGIQIFLETQTLWAQGLPGRMGTNSHHTQRRRSLKDGLGTKAILGKRHGIFNSEIFFKWDLTVHNDILAC